MPHLKGTTEPGVFFWLLSLSIISIRHIPVIAYIYIIYIAYISALNTISFYTYTTFSLSVSIAMNFHGQVFI